ncbi:non-ribosomal peptide synthetase module [Lasiosphaeris hirsuta]|uniref:Non-ribosomal peptide synthetase module n=1 Tax=Lasiosphaeris hirsuta TaxID=260670 RepID=A0AA40AZ33_9PEZI|nr:non-ribosomal peptide synthetase module [Lasiosphaeris hirsuta]
MLATSLLHNGVDVAHGHGQKDESIKNTLRNIWAEVLHDDPSMFADEDVFFEVGGDSVLAQKLITAAKSQGILLTMEQIFLNAALAEMAEAALVVMVPPAGKQHGDAPGAGPRPFSSLPSEGLGDRVETMAQVFKVPVQDIENAYPCSPMQESLLAELDDSTTLYLRQLVFKLSGDINLEDFRQAWQATLHANPVLRTRICHLGRELGHVQAVLRERAQWESVHGDLARFLERDAASPMRTGEPFFRYAIVEEDANSQRHFVWTVHHALCDGASLPEVLSEVSRRFRGETGPVREPFESFVQSTAVRPTDMSPEKTHWKRALSGINPTPYPAIPQHAHFQAQPTSVLEWALTLPTGPLLGGVTKPLLLRAAWAILLSHYTGTDDVGFGAVNNGRTAAVPGVSEMTGPTINLVPIVLHLDVEESVPSFLSRVRVQAAEMMPFEHAGMARIRRHLDGQDSTALGFQTLLVVHPTSFYEAVAPATRPLGLEYVDALGKKEHHPYPLVLTLTLSAGGTVNLSVQHDERVVSARQAQSMAHHFERVIWQLSRATRDTRLASISPFSEHDLRQIREWNAETPRTEDTTIHQLFREQVRKRPLAVAVCSVDESLTYLDVDTCSDSLALQLIDLGVGVGDFVGVCFDKSVWTVVAILAVFKAGGIYVPIDTAHPKSRIEEQVQRVGIKVALASSVGAGVLRDLCPSILTVDSRTPPPPAPPPSRALPSSIAYLLFTSGSTGKPKGLLMSHSAICTSIVHHGRDFAAGPHWRTLQFGAHTFDLSIGEFFTTLAHGGCICVPSEHDRLNDLAGAIAALGANTLLVVPTVANLLRPEDAPSLKTIVLAGEPITKETVTRWAAAVDLTCAYGPSETAVWCSGNLRVTADAHPANIGRAIGAAMWIVHPEDCTRLSAIGCVGEIVISGGLLGSGYFGDRAATDAAWVPAPDWLRATDPASAVLYRSGDLGRYNCDGTFQIVGRRDTQVKLRGFRIELGEIENQLMATGLVTAALSALPAAGPCAKNIVAVVCSTKPDLKNHDGGGAVIAVSRGERPLLERLRARLSLSLPDYMVPTVWIALAEMPLLISGKIDRRSIKMWIQDMNYNLHRELVEGPDFNGSPGRDIVAGSLADRLRHLWSEVLGVPAEHIGLRTSFVSMGGDSIAAIQIASRAKKRWGLAATVRSIVGTKTLGQLVALVEESGTLPAPNPGAAILAEDASRPGLYDGILQSRLQGQPPSVQAEQVYPLAPFQREILKARALNPAVFLLSWQMEVFSLTAQPVSLDALAEAWRRVVQQHTILRSIFLQDPARHLPAVQAVLTEGAQPEVAISSASSDEPEPTFATTNTPPVDECFLPHRALFSRHGDRTFVHIELDHLVIDGWSLKVIKECLLAACSSAETGTPTPSHHPAPAYQAFVAAHHPDRVRADDEHWAVALRDHEPSLLSLPVASSSSSTPEFSPEKTILYLPEMPAAALKPFSTQHAITPASIFDAAWAQTLSAHTRSPAVAFEYVVSGRDQDVAGVLDMVGPLINVLPYHIQLGEGPAQLARLAESMQQQRDRDGAHSASNVREVVEREVAGGRLCNTALNFQRRPTAVEDARLRVDDDLRKSRDPWHFDILVRVMHITDDDTFKASLEFDARFFREDGMREVAQDFWTRVQAGIISS